MYTVMFKNTTTNINFVYDCPDIFRKASESMHCWICLSKTKFQGVSNNVITGKFIDSVAH